MILQGETQQSHRLSSPISPPFSDQPVALYNQNTFNNRPQALYKTINSEEYISDHYWIQQRVGREDGLPPDPSVTIPIGDGYFALIVYLYVWFSIKIIRFTHKKRQK